MNKWFFFIAIPSATAVLGIGVGFTFGYLKNYDQYKLFNKIYTYEKGGKVDNTYSSKSNWIIFDQNKSFSQTLSEYNSLNSTDRQSYLNNRLANVYDSTVINMDTYIAKDGSTRWVLEDRIDDLSKMVVSDYSNWKAQYVLVKDYTFSLFQTKNYFSTLTNFVYENDATQGEFIFGATFLTIGGVSLIGFIIFYYTSKKHGQASDFEEDGFEFGNSGSDSANYSDSSYTKTIDLLSKNKEVKEYMDNRNPTVGFKNPVLQPKKPTTNNQKVSLWDNKPKNALVNSSLPTRNLGSTPTRPIYSNKPNTPTRSMNTPTVPISLTRPIGSQTKSIDLSKNLKKQKSGSPFKSLFGKKTDSKDKSKSSKDIDRILQGK